MQGLFLGNTLGLGGIGSSGPFTPILRTVANNGLPQADSASGANTHQVARWRYQIGSAAVKDIVMSFHNFTLTATGETVYTNQLIIDECWLLVGSTAVQVTWGGATSVTLAPGAADVQADAIPASAFSLSSFARDSSVDVRLKCHRPALENIPHSVTMFVATDNTNNQVGWYLPANTTINNMNGTGAFTVTGTALASATAGYRPIMLGHFVSGDPATWGAVGDSITQGLGDAYGAATKFGYGYFARSMNDDATRTNLRAFINCACAGQNRLSVVGTNTRCRAYWPYFKYAIEVMGTNDFNSSGVVTSAANMLLGCRDIWTLLRAAGVQKIIRPSIWVRTTSTDAWATDANQSVAAGWDAGGNVETFHNMLPAEVTAGNIDYYFRWSSELAATSNYKWITTGAGNYPTTDGVHPSINTHNLLDNELRTVVANYS